MKAWLDQKNIKINFNVVHNFSFCIIVGFTENFQESNSYVDGKCIAAKVFTNTLIKSAYGFTNNGTCSESNYNSGVNFILLKKKPIS